MQDVMKRGRAIAIAAVALTFAVTIVAPHQSLAAPAPASSQEEPKPGSKMTLTVQGVDFTFCYIPAGAFMMGSPESEAGRGAGEKLHKVIITKPFYMMENEITQEQYEVFGVPEDDGVQTLRSHFKGAKRPRESICFTDGAAKKFCDQMAKATQKKFRLPTEAEWEYACRAGTSTPFHYGNDLDWTLANFDGHQPYGNGARGKLRNETVEVKQFKPNAWGLYDMHGNVAEACVDYAPKGVDLHVDGIKDPGAVDPDAIGIRGSWHAVAYVGDPGAVVPAATKPQNKAKEGEVDPAASTPEEKPKADRSTIHHLGSDPGELKVDPEKVIDARVVFCGGGYSAGGSECRSAARLAISNNHAGNDFCGLRLVLIPSATGDAKPAVEPTVGNVKSGERPAADK